MLERFYSLDLRQDQGMPAPVIGGHGISRPSLVFAHHQDTKRGAIEGSLLRAGTANNQGACGFGRDP